MFAKTPHDIRSRPRIAGRLTQCGVLWGAFIGCVGIAVCGYGCTIISLVQWYSVLWEMPAPHSLSPAFGAAPDPEVWSSTVMGFVVLWLFFVCAAAVLWVKILATATWRCPRYSV